MKTSIWNSEVHLREYESLKGCKKTDVLVIGGGMCGVLCAYFLKQAGIDCLLVEGSKIASGITGNTTAKITYGHGLIYDKLLRGFGKEKALMYLTANKNALNEYEKLCSGINCDFEHKTSYVYSLTDRMKLEKEVQALNVLGDNAEFIASPSLPFKTKGAVALQNQGQFNPLKFIREIIKNLNIYEHTFIRDIAPHTAISDGGKITAEKIIVATHFPFINKHGNYFLKLYQHRSYVSAFENVPDINGMYVDENMKGLSFRTYNGLLFIGGGGHRTGKHGGNWKELNLFAKKYYPNAVPVCHWATQDCMSLDGVPYIGLYSKKTPDLYVAAGFNKWGMTSSMVAAKILCDMVRGKENEYSRVFSPDRSILHPQLFMNSVEATLNLLTPTTKRCPHLGCALKWNESEHSWDCPCHGSRFEKDGKLIDNPATGDANVK